MAARLLVEEVLKVCGVHQVAVDTDRQAKGRVYIEGLSLRTV